MKKFLGLFLTAVILLSGFAVSAAESETNSAANFNHGYVPTKGFQYALNEGASYTLDGNKINFVGAGDGAGIAPIGSYSEFAIQFDVSGYTPGQASWVGLAFGQPAQDSLFFQSSQLLAIFNDGAFVYDFNNGGAPYALTGSEIAAPWIGGLRTWSGGNDTLVDDNEPDEGFGNKVNTFKIVLKRGTVSLYRKNNIDENGDARFALIDGQWGNLSKSEGFLKICFTGSTTIAVDNILFSSNPDADLSKIVPVEETLIEGTETAPVLEAASKSIKASWTMSAGKYCVNLFDKNGKFVTSKLTTDKSLTFSDLAVGTYKVQVVAIESNGLAGVVSKSAEAEVKAETPPSVTDPSETVTTKSTASSSTDAKSPDTSDSTSFAAIAIASVLAILAVTVLLNRKAIQAK